MLHHAGRSSVAASQRPRSDDVLGQSEALRSDVERRETSRGKEGSTNVAVSIVISAVTLVTSARTAPPARR